MKMRKEVQEDREEVEKTRSKRRMGGGGGAQRRWGL